MTPARRQEWAVASTLVWILVFWVGYADDGVGALADRIARKPDHRALPPDVAGETSGKPDVAEDTDHASALDPAAEDDTATTRAAAKARTIEDICIDGTADACRRWAMDGFYAAFAAAHGSHPDRPLRISYYGDSVTSTDVLPGHIRHRLQAMLGDGGPGWVWAVPPHRYVKHQIVASSPGGDWTIWSASLSPVGDGLHGVAGGSEQTVGGTTLLSSKTAFTDAEVYYLAQPGGGSADLALDGTVATTIDTAATAKEARFVRVHTVGGARRVKLTAHGKVRLFGLVLENATGAVVDNMGLVSATVKSFAHNRADHWTKQIAHRGADLVIVMVGANEASWLPPGQTAMADYTAQYAAILAPIRQALPLSTCLVVSPLDQAHVNDDNELAPRPVMPKMVAAQRRAAAEAGCAFFSAYDWAGGKGSSLKWRARGWIGDDFQHLSLEGADKLGDAIVDALLAGAQDYQVRAP